MAKKKKKNTFDHKKALETLSEAVVLTDPRDYRGMAEMLTIIEKIVSWADDEGNVFVSGALNNVSESLESIILESADDPQKTFDSASAAVAALQQVVIDGREPLEAGFPEELLPADMSTGGGDGFVLPPHVDEEIFSEFLSRQPGVLEEMEGYLLDIEKGNNEDFPALKRLIHTLKGEAGLLALHDVERLCHTAEDALSEDTVVSMTDTLLEMKDWLSTALEYYGNNGPEPDDVDTLIERLENAPDEETEKLDKAQEIKKKTKDSPAVDETVEEAADPAASAMEDEEPLEDEYIDLEGDLELVSDFVTEANEHLDNADVHVLTLETNPKDDDALNAVFRAFHTIKGVAGFLMLKQVGELAHESENLLDLARKGDIELTGVRIDVTFDAIDSLKRLISDIAEALEGGTQLRVDRDANRLIKRIKSVIEGGEDTPEEPAEKRDEMVGEILKKDGKITDEELDEAYEKQQQAPQKKRIGEVLVEDVETSSLRVNRALEKQKTSPDRKVGDILVESGDVSKDSVERAAEKQKDPQKPKIGEVLVREKRAAARDVATALRSQAGAGSSQRTVKVKETVKVDADRLDRLVDLIGELVIAESMVTQSKEVTRLMSSDFARQVRHLDKITRELQEMGTGLRMVPVRPIFQKMARLARDLSRKSGKPVEFVTSGEDTELDKSVVDRIGDPLVHMVRNAIDHGIEASVADRERRGKAAAGRVELRAFHKGGSIYIEIEDDGQGLNRDKILSKALERGVIKGDEQLSDKDIYNLIFEPGFSTAAKVTDVSGRGVGMDVVRKNIESLRGQVEIRSEPGQGSVFTLRLPLTLAIIDGMVVRVGDEQYIIPTLSVVRSIRPNPEDVNTVLGKGEMLKVQDHLIPLFRLHRLFTIEGAKETLNDGIVIVVEDDNLQTGIMVDDLLGQQQIVIKSLGETLKNVRGLAGGAIMPDGRVGLILDVSGLVRLANSGDIDYETLAAENELRTENSRDIAR